MPRRDGITRVCVVASAGGHLEQIMRVAQAWAEFPAVYVSTSQAVRDWLRQKGKVYIIAEAGKNQRLGMLVNVLRCLRILLKERPHVVISSGSGPGCVMCILAKLLGAKVLWLDSVANMTRLSRSGRIVRLFADLCLTQWPLVASKYKAVEYAGTLI